MNLSTSGMLSNFRQDIVSRQLSRSASSGGRIFDPTSSAQKSNHETDKQAEENATWFFEYKALLNSKLTTLTTALTSAYTTDLDASMTKADALWGGKNAMQGITGTQRDLLPPAGNDTTVIDPGAARTTHSYFSSFGFGITPTPNLPADLYGNATIEADTLSYTFAMASTGGNLTNYTTGATIGTSGAINSTVGGTTTFSSGGSTTSAPLLLDKLYIDLADNKNNNYFNIKTAAQRVTPYPTSIEQGKNIGNNLELTLYKFFSKPENYDLIRFGLMDELYVVGTSSLATGSQIQGSISLRYVSASVAGNTINNSYIEVKQERYSCFFHS